MTRAELEKQMTVKIAKTTRVLRLAEEAAKTEYRQWMAQNGLYRPFTTYEGCLTIAEYIRQYLPQRRHIWLCR